MCQFSQQYFKLKVLKILHFEIFDKFKALKVLLKCTSKLNDFFKWNIQELYITEPQLQRKQIYIFQISFISHIEGLNKI